jgi:hypothetical protein
VVRWIPALGLAFVLFAGCGNRRSEDPVERMRAALGGARAIDQLESLSVMANCAGPGGHFKTWVESLRPGSVHFRQSDGIDSIAVWSTPDSTWLGNGDRYAAGDARVRAFVRGHEFHLEILEVETRFTDHAVAGKDTVEGHVCTRVTMKDEFGDPAVLLIDDSNDLPRMLELNPPGAEGPVRAIFDDWKRLDGLMYFFSIRMTEGPERSFLYRYQEIVPDGVDPSVFDTRRFQ